MDKGCEALEQLFENKQPDYLKPDRKCLLMDQAPKTQNPAHTSRR
jgi:hypothetical protein